MAGTALNLIERTLDIPHVGTKVFKWPEGDECLWKWAHQASHIDAVLPFLNGRGVCVQAGGGCGVWPAVLAGMFETVYTFEPFIPNFKALSINCAEYQNVLAFNACLGDSHGCVDIGWASEKYAINYGAQYAVGQGVVPVFRLDDLALKECDFICLDIEGAELEAVRGAEQTIKECRPVIMIEEAGHAKHFGNTERAARDLVVSYGYKVISKTRDDVLLVPNG